MAGVALDGKKISAEILAELKPRVREITKRRGRPPCLAVILVGDDPASQIYVSKKIKACQELGIRSVELRPPGNITTDALFGAVDPIIKDKTIDAILVQVLVGTQPVRAARLHASGHHAIAAAFEDCSGGEACGGSGAQRHGGETDGVDVAARKRDGYDLPFAHSQFG